MSFKRLLSIICIAFVLFTSIAPSYIMETTENIVVDEIQEKSTETLAPVEEQVATEAPATNTPEPTAAPATSTPEPTKVPETSTPEPTEAPATPVVTEAPVTSKPVATEALVTDSPVDTETPVTDAPIVTEAPVTDEPVDTEAPTTIAPVETETVTTNTVTPASSTPEPTSTVSATTSVVPSIEPSISPEPVIFEVSALGSSTATLVKYNGNDKIVSIPTTVDGLKITEISTNAFLNNSVIEKLIIPEGVKKIQKDAIVNCKLLNNIELPKSLNFIDVNAFRNVEDRNHGDGIKPTYKVDARSYAFGFILENRYKYSTVEPKSNFEYDMARDAKANVIVGDIVSLTIPESNYGGTPPYQYTTYIYCNNSVVEHIPFTSSRIVTYRFTSPGAYEIKSWVRDSNQVVVNSINPAVYTVTGAYTHQLQVYGTVNKTQVTLGEECIFYAHPSGGAAPYTYAYYLFKDNVRIATTAYSTDIYYTYKPTAAGNYHVTIFAKDSLGRIVTSNTPVISVQPYSPLSLNVSVNKTSVNLGENIIFTAQAKNGTSPYIYAFYLFRDNALIHRGQYSNNNTFTYKADIVGTYKVNVFVKDSKTTIAYKTSVNVTAGALQNLTAYGTINGNLNPVTINIGESVTFGTVANGGVKPYRYAYYIYKDNLPVYKGTYSNINSFTYIPTSPGIYKAGIFVRDASGKQVSSFTSNVTVSGSSTALSLIATATPSGQYVGNTISFKGLATGGSIPYKYAFYVYKDDVRVANIAYGANSIYNYRPTSAGTYYATVFVMDATGKRLAIDTIKTYIQVSNVAPLQINSNSSSYALHTNEILFVTAMASGGVSPYQFAFYVIKDGVTIYKGAYGNNPLFEYTPTVAGTYKITSFVKDSRNIRAANTTNNIVVSTPAPQPINIYTTLDKVNLELGNELSNKVTIRAFASNGISPYTYAFYVVNVNTNTNVYKGTYTQNSSFTYTPTEVGTYKFIAFVKDSTGTTAFVSSTNFIVTAPTRKVVLNASIANNYLNLNTIVTGYGSNTPTGYSFYILKDGITIFRDTNYNPSSTYSYYLGTSGNYSGLVFVKYNGITDIDTATSNSVPFTFSTPKYRALLIGNSDYAGDYLDLPGCAQDVSKMNYRLASKAPYGQIPIFKHENLYAHNLAPAIQTAFKGADSNSVSIFYYSGHATDTGFLMGTDNQTVSPSTLANALKNVPGKVIVILDCCYSGLYINRSTKTNEDAYKKFNQSVVSAFRNVDVMSKAGELLDNKFHVITSSSKDQPSYGISSGSYFTTGLLGAGDSNNDGYISMYEAFVSGKSYGYSETNFQVAQAYPSNDQLFLFKK